MSTGIIGCHNWRHNSCYLVGEAKDATTYSASHRTVSFSHALTKNCRHKVGIVSRLRNTALALDGGITQETVVQWNMHWPGNLDF
jgi:hypothetical protein